MYAPISEPGPSTIGRDGGSSAVAASEPTVCVCAEGAVVGTLASSVEGELPTSTASASASAAPFALACVAASSGAGDRENSSRDHARRGGPLPCGEARSRSGTTLSRTAARAAGAHLDGPHEDLVGEGIPVGHVFTLQAARSLLVSARIRRLLHAGIQKSFTALPAAERARRGRRPRGGRRRAGRSPERRRPPGGPSRRSSGA